MMIYKGGLNARLESVRVHTLKRKDGSVEEGGGCIGSQEVDVRFYTYQRLLLCVPSPLSTSHGVRVCVCLTSR